MSQRNFIRWLAHSLYMLVLELKMASVTSSISLWYWLNWKTAAGRLPRGLLATVGIYSKLPWIHCRPLTLLWTECCLSPENTGVWSPIWQSVSVVSGEVGFMEAESSRMGWHQRAFYCTGHGKQVAIYKFGCGSLMGIMTPDTSILEFQVSEVWDINVCNLKPQIYVVFVILAQRE